MGRALCFVASVMAFASTSVSGQVNSWINPTSGNWDQASSWSLGVLPSSSQSVMITNSGWKAVAINPSTPVNFPGSMTVSNLTIRGAFDTENVLLLNYFGTALPLTVSPKPDAMVRVMIGRHDLLTPERERELDGLIKQMPANPTASTRWAAVGCFSPSRTSSPQGPRTAGSVPVRMAGTDPRTASCPAGLSPG